MITMIGAAIALGVVAITTIWVLSLRTIVPPNDMHIITQGKNVKSYGKDQTEGNVYYRWPSWMPVFGMNVEVLPVSNFELKLKGYEEYDRGRVPFVVDITAFFRIKDTNKAAQRVENAQVLYEQLEEIVRGAVRRILATSDIDTIMVERAKLAGDFTEQITEQIGEWGIEVVKNIEFMDIRDADGEKVIFNIMEKKRSQIERESRIEVAENMRQAQEKEIEAKQSVDIRDQEAMQAVGERTAQKNQAVGIADEVSKQEIKSQEKVTMEKDMSVLQVQQVRNQEIAKEREIVKAQEDKETAILRAEAQKEQTVIVADGDLIAKEKEAKGIIAEGHAQAEAEKEMQLAPVHAQIELAREIGENDNYQNYLQTIEGIGAYKVVGTEQAKALVESDLKVIVNSGDTTGGVSNMMDLFTSKGGTNLTGMLEAIKQSDGGQAVLSALGVGTAANETATPDTTKVTSEADSQKRGNSTARKTTKG